jgi:outer membrane porin, OprD family
MIRCRDMESTSHRLREHGVRATSPVWLAWLAGAAMTLVACGAMAQSLPTLSTADDELTSKEDGQVPLGEGYAVDEQTRRDRIREQRRQGFADTEFDVQLRTFLLDRDKYDSSRSYAWAIGGSAGFKTGYFRDRFALAATGYTSQPLDAPKDTDGTNLLKKGQEGYSVLGEAYVQVRIADGVNLNIGRKSYETPYVNRMDIRMTPNTFEAIALQGVSGDKKTGEWSWGLGYFDKIKEKNADQFKSMSVSAGSPSDVKRGVYSAGANYTAPGGAWSFGAADYYSDDIINIFYTEARYKLRLGDKHELRLAAQYSDQRSTGQDLLFGESFSTNQWGIKADYPVGPMLLTAAYTSMSDDYGLQNPWAAYPSYTTAQVEEFRRAGEQALKLRASLKVPKVSNLVVFLQWVNGTDPVATNEYAKDEYNFDVQWEPKEGKLKGFMFRMRYAHDTQANATDQDDLRLIVYWTPQMPGQK